jgi:hypothetical protein
MGSLRYIRFIFKVLGALVREPGDALRIVRSIPLILDGSDFAKAWQTSELPSSDDRGSEQRESSRLKSYFNSHLEGRGITKWTHYFDIYELHLRKFVGNEVHIVEVGVFSGGSMDMWHSYFGRHCTVYGIDIREECKAYENERTRIFIGDQGDKNFWKSFLEKVPRIDVVIDDGSHLPEHQIITLEELLPMLRPGGVYICEDVHGSHNRFPGYIHGLSTQLNSMITDGPELSPVRTIGFQRAIQSVHLYAFLTVIEKSNHDLGRLESIRRGTEWQPFV